MQRAISVRTAKSIFNSLLPDPLTLHQHEAHLRLQSLTLTSGKDDLIWRFSASGQFTVKSIYRVLSKRGKITSTLCSIWRARVTPSMTLFFFLLLHNRLLTHDVMLRRHLPFSPGCVMCHAPFENVMHLFFLCPYVATLWNSFSVASGYTMPKLDETLLQTYLASALLDKDHRRSWLVTFITATFLL